ncbi:MAG: hypothetical protein HS111_15125 [Kofleriaceae bacterium]|nr:hypothetical protein [Kofleriaceae bacterium]
MLDEDPELARPEHAALRRILERRLAAALAFGSEGGWRARGPGDAAPSRRRSR